MPSISSRVLRIDRTLMEDYRDTDDNAALTDLLTDALHYCSINGNDFAKAMKRAQRTFAFETQMNEGDLL